MAKSWEERLEELRPRITVAEIDRDMIHGLVMRLVGLQAAITVYVRPCEPMQDYSDDSGRCGVCEKRRLCKVLVETSSGRL